MCWIILKAKKRLMKEAIYWLKHREDTVRTKICLVYHKKYHIRKSTSALLSESTLKLDNILFITALCND